MKKQKVYPSISGSATRPAVAVNAEVLKTSGIPFATYGINPGDKIEFPDSWDDVDIWQQPVRVGGTAMQTLIGVLRNGNASYLSLGVLRRQDADRNYTCDFTKELGEMDNDYARVEHLFGKAIQCNGMKEVKIQDFDRLTGERLETTHMGKVPVIEYV